MMRSEGAGVDPVLKAKIEKYMSLITANLLNACVSYEQWNQKHALTDETKVSIYELLKLRTLSGCAEGRPWAAVEIPHRDTPHLS